MISNAAAFGIKGAVDYKDNLPATGVEGEIWIVRGTSGDGNNDGQYTINDDTILFTKLDGNFDDEVGNYTETINSNIAVWSEGRVNQAVSFRGWDGDGTDDERARYSPTVKSFTPGEISGGMWIYSTVDNYEKYNPLFHMWKKGPKKGMYLLLKDGRPKFWVGTCQGHKEPHAPTKISKDTWTHIGFSYSNVSKMVKIYINGILNKEESLNDGGTIVQESDYLYFGYNIEEQHGPDDSIKIDEFFLQEGELSENDFQTIINGSFYGITYDEGFYTWNDEVNGWIWLANNTSPSATSISHPISQDSADELTSGQDTDLHNHDGRYYTEDETDDLLDTYANVFHNHDERYYTESEIDNKLSNIKYSDISSNDSSTNVTGAELETLTNGSDAVGLHTHSDLGGGGLISLDDAYDNNNIYSNGEGRTISVDAGSVEFNASGGFAPIKLPPLGYTPNQWLNGGELCVRDGELYLYDATRSSWVSTFSMTIGGGYNSNNVKNKYFKGFNGTSMNSRIGWCAPWDGVVVAMSIVSDHDNCSNSVVLKKDGSNTTARIYYNNEYNNSASNINVQFSQNDVLSFYMCGDSENANRPQAWAIVKRRI